MSRSYFFHSKTNLTHLHMYKYAIIRQIKCAMILLFIKYQRMVNMYFEGLIIGAGAFLIIGIMHPVVIKAEYYFGTKAWGAFLIIGLGAIMSSLYCSLSIVSMLLAIVGFSFLWSIHELFEQKKRVQKGWFPQNPNRPS